MADLLGISGTQHTWNKTHASGGPCMTNPEKKWFSICLCIIKALEVLKSNELKGVKNLMVKK